MLAGRSFALSAPSGPPVRCNGPSVTLRSRYRATHLRQVCKCSSDAAADLCNRLSQSEESNDWATALEIVTEAKVLKVDLPTDACECAVRVFADSEVQWKRAADLFEGMLERGISPSDNTAQVLFRALVSSGQGTKALTILQKLESTTTSAAASAQSLSVLYNMTVRAHVKQGDVDMALTLLEKMVQSDGRIQSEEGTFSAVAGAFLRKGDDARAEEVLDMRDYF